MTNIAAAACKRAPISFVAAFALLPLAEPAQAQKEGGSSPSAWNWTFPASIR